MIEVPTFDVPPIGPRQGKVWGDTQLLFAHHGVEVHRIRFRAGAYCSKHKHKHKWNRFIVLRGTLKINVWWDGVGEDVTIVGPGEVTDVPPGQLHRFEALEDGEALEIYWVKLSANDIVRVDQGGRS